MLDMLFHLMCKRVYPKDSGLSR